MTTKISQLTTELSSSLGIFHEDPPVGGTDVDIQLLEAAKAGDMELVKKLISAHPHSVNCRDLKLNGRHSTPLHVAAGYNRVTVVDFLLTHGADVHAKDKGGLVPLHNACSYGHYEVTELLIKHGADVNVADLWKFTPLHEAAAKGKLEICKLLVKHGADATKKNKDGNTPLDLVKEGDHDEADLLRSDAALSEAAQKGNLSREQKLSTQENINCRDNQGRNSTPLHLVEIKKEGRTNPNRAKFRKLSREVCGEVCDIPENNSVRFVYEKRPSKVSLIGEISYQFCDLKMDSPGSNFDSEYYSQITFMFVKEDYQLQGIGKKLVKKVLNEFKSHDKIRPIRIQSAGRAVGFFEKLGFVKVGEIMETVCGISVFRFMQNMERPRTMPT
ncbi:poly [ADP-ribose] polymerase tankyrase-1-like isoform X1 [Mytilus galloprovincialis]|uniref:poly [ADP-ribose] polymerase tankyrase-1-like isoform X1 n=1 Tax=Mytilus galloprovincialis TaxID=29158 RepID=UPI003F7BE2F8